MRPRLAAALVTIVTIFAIYASAAEGAGYFVGSISMIERPNNVLHSAAEATLYNTWGNIDYSMWWVNHLIGLTPILAITTRQIDVGQYNNFLEATGAAGLCYRSAINLFSQNNEVRGYYGSNQVCLTAGSGGGGGGGLCFGDGGGGGGDDNQDIGYCSLNPTDPCCTSPILIDLDGGGFKLTGANDPVRFDLNANGSPEATGWTERGSQTAFLVLDLDGDGRIDDGRELFGNYTPMPDGTKAANGYVALEVHDEPAYGGNGDGRISDDDVIYPRLQLWIDFDHNGRTDPGELVSLEDAGVESINLRYREEKRVDRWGNAFKYRSSATLVNDRGRRRHVDTYDVYFVKVRGQ